MSVGGKSPAVLNRIISNNDSDEKNTSDNEDLEGNSSNPEEEQDEKHTDENQNSEGEKDLSTEDEEEYIADDPLDAQELLQDNYRASGVGRLKQVKKAENPSSGNYSSESESDLEDSDGETSNKRASKFENVDTFIVGDDGHYVRNIVHEIKISEQSTLESDKVLNAIALFDQDNESFQSASRVPSEEKKPEEPTPELFENVDIDFERECDKIQPYLGIIEQNLDYFTDRIVQKFESRIPNTEYDINLDLNKKAIQDILQDLCHGYTIQFIIRYHSHIFTNTIITEEDLYSFHSYIKEISWIIKSYQELVDPLVDTDTPNTELQNIRPDEAEDIPSDIEDLIAVKVEDYKAFEKSILTNSQDEISFNTIRNYMNYEVLDSKYRHYKELFSQFVHSFVTLPTIFGMLILPESEEFSAQFCVKDCPPPEPISPRLSSGKLLSHVDDFLNYLYDPYQFIDSDSTELKFIKKPLDQEFSSVDSMKERMIQWAAKELSISPYFLSSLRHLLSQYFVINTTPTPKGMRSSAMQPNGKYGIVKRLKGKTLPSFEKSDRWLLIEEAKQNGLLNYEFQISFKTNEYDEKKELDKNQFFNEVLLSKYIDKLPSIWDEMRKKILTIAFQDCWKKLTEEEEEKLIQISQAYVKEQIEKKLYSILTAPPFLSMNEDYLERPSANIPYHETKSIFSFFYDQDKRMIGFCIVGSNGNVEFHEVYTKNFILSKYKLSQQQQISADQISTRDKDAKQAKEKIQTKLTEYFKKNNIACLICNSSAGNFSFLLYDALLDIVRSTSQLLHQEARSSKINEIPILFVQSDSAIIYSRCEVSDQERQDLSARVAVDPIILVAASMARRVQDPLSEITRLVTPTKNHLLELNLHRFQTRFLGDSIQARPIYEAAERACLKAVAAVGLDANRLMNPNYRGPLQFIPGLGPNWAEKFFNLFKKQQINTKETFSFSFDTESDKAINSEIFEKGREELEKLQQDIDFIDNSEERQKMSDLIEKKRNSLEKMKQRKDAINRVRLNAFDFIRFSTIPDHKDQEKDILHDSLLILEEDVPLAVNIINYGLGNPLNQPIGSSSQIYDFYSQKLTDQKFFSLESQYQFILQKHHSDNFDNEADQTNTNTDETNQGMMDDDILNDIHLKQKVHNIFNEIQIGPFESLRINPTKQFSNHSLTNTSREREREELLQFRKFRDTINKETTRYLPSFHRCTVIYEAINDDELFDDFTNHDETLQVNSLCIFDILNMNPDHTYEVLHPGSGIRGKASFPRTPLDPIVVKQPHEGVILEVDKKCFKIRVSFEKRDIEEARSFKQIYKQETAFNIVDEEKIQEEFERQEKERPRVLNRRQFGIEDEHYQNVTITEATQWLMKRDQLGEFVIRPSLKGNEYLVLMIKFPNNTIASYDIVERGKRDPNDPRIGKELWIENKQYDDIDHIRWSFVERIKEELIELTQFGPKGATKWIDDMEAAQNILLQEKSKFPQQAVWRFTIDPSLASSGVVILKWLRNTHEGFINEPIRLLADGFKFRDTIYPELSKLIEFWKKIGFKTVPERGTKTVFRQITETEENNNKQKKEMEQQKVNIFSSRRTYYGR